MAGMPHVTFELVSVIDHISTISPQGVLMKVEKCAPHSLQTPNIWPCSFMTKYTSNVYS
jgi:hypothetical protein